MEEKNEQPYYSRTDSQKVEKTNPEWKELLPKELYNIAREKGTERPFTSKYNKFDEVGNYYCAVCGNALFQSDAKFASSCGWPSFFEPVTKDAIVYLKDTTFGMQRTEVQCGRCHSHLGHVFEDGPPPTGLRYCINGVILDFEKAQAAAKQYDADNNK
ncbi:peptide-methionine (R)-S-oxide reductase MsrB [Arachidicoccus sp.]|uniref:peptide-methionine (R)-S-oxide reductase MsrB n=1 Tax=Arachidicoccus sp. TaxID=1872624 RepID=UPI003D196738